MKVTIHQPTYLPYLGVFYKISSSDIFIVYDNAQYEKGSVHNRQRIRTDQGSTWITIPLKSSLTPFNETVISYADRDPWYDKHWRSIELNYKKTPFFGRYRDRLSALFHEGHPKTLGEFNLSLISFLLEAFGIDRKIVMFSELGIDPELSPSEKLAVATRVVGGNHYIAGPSAKKYMALEPFIERGIEVSYFEFIHPKYPQYHTKFDGEFIANMTALDALFNIGGLPGPIPSTQQNEDLLPHAKLPHPSSRDKEGSR